MKSDFLKSLGITDQEIIDASHAENGKDITNVRRQLEAMQSERDSLQTQLTERDNQLKELKKSVKDNEELTSRLEALEAENKTAKETYAAELANLKKSNAIEIALKDDKAKSVKAVMPFLNVENIKFENDTLVGYKEQIESLKSDEATSFLFDAAQPTQPTKPPLSGAKPADPTPPTGGNPQGVSFRDAVYNAISGKK